MTEPRTADPTPAGARRPRTLALSLNTGAAILLAAVLLGMINVLAARYYRRADWSRAQYYALSEKTKSLLASLTNTVEVISFITPDSSDHYEEVMRLLKEYESASDRIHVERLNPHRDIARTKELAARYGVKELSVVVFDSNGRSKFVRDSEIMDMDYTAVAYGQQPMESAFKGEQAFSSAIQSTTQGEKPVIYFLKGHGERDIENFDRYAGYSEIAAEIRGDNVEARTFSFGETKALPEDCSVLVIAGPDKKFAQPELDLLSRYLESNGRLLVLADAATRTGLEPILEEWGVRLADDVVVDIQRTITGRELLLAEYGSHPITRPLADLVCMMYFPRSVTIREEEAPGPQSPDKPRLTALASCSASGWAESDVEQSPMKLDPQTDRPGPISVAVAVERGAGGGVNVQLRPLRMVVFGDSDFVANSALAGGNLDFFLGALNWLLEREELMAIAPKPVEQMRLMMTGGQLSLLFWIVVVLLPGAVAVLGIAVWLRRRV